MNFTQHKKLIIGASVWLFAATSAAYAAPIPYSFSAGPSSGGAFADFIGSSISGTFMYDPAAMQTGTTAASGLPANAALYGGNYTTLNATVSGGGLSSIFTFSDPRGTTIVSNDGFRDTLTGQLVDSFHLDADPFGPGGTHNIVPFAFGSHTLWNMRFFWIEGQNNPGTVPEFLGNQSLLPVLPSIQGRLFLDFIPTGSTTGTPLSFVFFDRLLVTPMSPIPEPETYALLLAGLGLIGFVARRRQRARMPRGA